jgi:hypothetical protein
LFADFAATWLCFLIKAKGKKVKSTTYVGKDEVRAANGGPKVHELAPPDKVLDEDESGAIVAFGRGFGATSTTRCWG